VKPPDVSVEDIEDSCEETGLRPIVWLEELDKFSATKNRLDLLNSLVDGVYEKKGLVIVTTNLTRPELLDHLGEATYRRIAGTIDDPQDFAIWDFFEVTKPVTGKS
jgi:hypothetical protein